MSKQYKRTAEVIISGKTEALDVSNLRIVFEIEKDLSNIPNLALIRIYNLSQSSRNKIEEELQKCIDKSWIRRRSKPVV